MSEQNENIVNEVTEIEVGGEFDEPTPIADPLAEIAEESVDEEIANDGEEPIEGDDQEAESVEDGEESTKETTQEETAEVAEFVVSDDKDVLEEVAQFKQVFQAEGEAGKLLDKMQAEIVELRAKAEAVGTDNERINRYIEADKKLFELSDNDDVNVEPLILATLENLGDRDFGRFIRTTLRNIPSAEMEGKSMLFDLFAKESGKTVAELQAFVDSSEMPTIPPQALPSYVPENLLKGYWNAPQIYRLRMENIVNTIQLNKQNLANEKADEYPDALLIQEYEEKIALGEEELKGEIESIQLFQEKAERAEQEKIILAEQQQKALVAHHTEVATAYGEKQIEWRDSFLKILTPALSNYYTESEAKAHALDMLARVENATEYDNPAKASYYINQLKAEGVTFDFKKGNELLENYYTLLDKVVANQKQPNFSQIKLKAQQTRLKEIETDILTQMRQIVGQLSAKRTNGFLGKQKEVAKKVLEKHNPFMPIAARTESKQRQVKNDGSLASMQRAALESRANLVRLQAQGYGVPA